MILTALVGLHCQADRYLVRVYLDMGQVGIYSVANQVAGAVSTLCLLPFATIWQVVIYEIAAQSNAKQVYSKVFKYFVYVIALGLFGVSLFAKPILSVMASADYGPAADLVPVICLSLLFETLHLHFNVPVLLAKKTFWLLPACAVALAANIGINLLTIPFFGAVGATWGRVPRWQRSPSRAWPSIAGSTAMTIPGRVAGSPWRAWSAALPASTPC